LPLPSPSELQALQSSAAADASKVGVQLAASLDAATAAVSAAAADKLPPGAISEAQALLQKVLAALPPPPADLPPPPAEVLLVLQHPEVLEPLGPPAAAGAVLTAMLWLRSGPKPWLEELPRDYNYGYIKAYWDRRPLKLFARFAEAGVKVGWFTFLLYLDEWTGRLEANRPERAVQGRELITDLGVTWVKIAQVWASRPDILPKEYIKEYEKLLEQVRPFGRDEAMETLRRSKDKGDLTALSLFDDLSSFESPVASASVGQVYKARINGKTVAVKVQRPDVREISTLDLYVIRNFASLGALLPIQRIATQSRNLIELLDLTAPTFITELDYEREAANQERFANMVKDCDLICDTVEVPGVLFSSKEVLVQEWLDGVKLTQPGAAQQQAGKVVKLLLNSYMVQFLETGFLHGDPHPGNFILMDSGKLGILDYGLMTEITGEKRLAFIEFLMHLQAKDYGNCLQDLINLEFFPAALGNDKEALDVIVPTLRSTLSTLYEEGGDLKKKQEMFAKQREEMKASGKLDTLRTQLQEISKKYSGAFRLPPYFTLIIRAFSTLEGLGLKNDANFAIVKECFPYIARRLITDDSFRMRNALKSYLYKGRTRIAVSRIDELTSGFGKFTNLMKGSRKSAEGAGGPTVLAAATEDVASTATGRSSASPATRSESNGAGSTDTIALDTATTDIARVVFSPDGNFLQDLLIEEGVAAVDALSRATLLSLLRTLGPLALPLALPLGFLLGGNASRDSRIVTREDKESLLILRRIVRLVQAGGRNSGGAGASPEMSTTDIRGAAEDLRRLQPLADGLLPVVAPGASAFARRFATELARRVLLRVADDIESNAGFPRRTPPALMSSA